MQQLFNIVPYGDSKLFQLSEKWPLYTLNTATTGSFDSKGSKTSNYFVVYYLRKAVFFNSEGEQFSIIFLTKI